MKQKTKVLTESLLRVISAWNGVECVLLSETAQTDTLHPYFVLIMDVYVNGEIPDAEMRREAYGNAISAFESSRANNKDRFLVGDIPVRIEYKECRKITERVEIATDSIDQLWKIKDSGTYIFHRITCGQILFQRSDWIDAMREKLEGISVEYWDQMRQIHMAKMEHYLADLGAAMVQDDDFNYMVSAASFIKYVCMSIFCANRVFEPSHRYYSAMIRKMEKLPEEFITRFDSFLGLKEDMPKDRKFALAQLIAKSVLAMV